MASRPFAFACSPEPAIERPKLELWLQLRRATSVKSFTAFGVLMNSCRCRGSGVGAQEALQRHGSQ
ncbi:hypothetical protein F511_06689 [Dorcoceras hygrometricum]|uniref:Uncharacterized protein n=1 Tax=Dorcoceras hygrometricum TaxID=472368 RepID=A0A2Z7BR08_9LAMI|nr:hypothetical protein F511_06689 [Dorcoceras hygrometricum]